MLGRSMGAATALIHGDRDPSIAGMVLDSAFADLEQLAQELVERIRQEGYTVPRMVVAGAIRMLRSSVQKRAGFDIRTKEMKPISHVDKCFIPALFVHGREDEFIQPHHSEELHAKYAGDKNLIKVEGDHHHQRPQFMLDSACIFLTTALHVPQQFALESSGAPWWHWPAWLA